MTGSDWVRLGVRYGKTCRKGSGGCGRWIVRGETAWMRLPEQGRRKWSVLLCTRCGERNGLTIKVEPSRPAADPDAFLPPGAR